MPDNRDRPAVLQLVTFTIGDEAFGIDILQVQEIIRPVAVTRVPHAPAFVEGMINLRGRVVPILDLRKRFGLPARAADRFARVLVVEVGDRIVGFLVDAVREVLHVETAQIEPPPAFATGIDGHYITGIARLEERLLILLDLLRVLTPDERAALPTIPASA